jgi:hypothetical protein
MKYPDIFSDHNFIAATSTDFTYNFCLQSKSTHQVLKSQQDYRELKLDVIQSDMHGPLIFQSHGGIRYLVMIIDKFCEYIDIDLVLHLSGIKSIFYCFYNLIKIQFSAKIKKPKSDNRCDYANKEMTTLLETNSITHGLSLPYTHKSNLLPAKLNCTIEMIIQYMSLNNVHLILQALYAE